MKTITKSAIAALLVTAAPIASSAEGVSLSYGLSVASEYVSQGFEYSDGATFGTYVEAAMSGAYAGIYAQSGDAALLGASVEYGVYLGYGNTIGAFSYDLNYNYYWYNDSAADDLTEVVATGTYALSDAVYASLRYGYMPEFNQSDISASIDYYTNVPGLAVAATYGQVDSDFGFGPPSFQWTYWSIGASYAIADNVTLDVTWHDADDDGQFLGVTDGIAVFSFMLDF